MLTNREIRGFGWVFKACCNSGLLPYTWNARTRKLTALQSRSRLYPSVASLLFKLVYCIYKAWRIPAFLETPKWKSEGTIYFIYVACWLTCASMYYNSIIQRNGIANVVNSVMDFNMRQGKRYLGLEFGKPGSIRETFVLISLADVTLFCSLMVLYFSQFPTQYHFFYSAFCTSEASVNLESLTFWAFLALESFATISLCLMYTFAVVIQFMYIVTMKFWLKRAFVEWPAGRQKGLKTTVKPEDLLRLYRKMTLINAEFNRSHSHFVTPVSIISMLTLTIQSIYSSIRFSDSLPLPMTFLNVGMVVLAAVQLIVGTSLAASLHTMSGACQRNVKQLLVRQSKMDHQHRHQLLKQVNTCRPFGFQVGSCYVIKRETKGTVLNFLINVVAFLLLTKH